MPIGNIFKRRNQRVEELEERNQQLEDMIAGRMVESIKELDQKKIYVLTVEDSLAARTIKDQWQRVLSQIEWTTPPIIIKTKDIALEEVDEGTLQWAMDKKNGRN